MVTGSTVIGCAAVSCVADNAMTRAKPMAYATPPNLVIRLSSRDRSNETFLNCACLHLAQNVTVAVIVSVYAPGAGS